MPLVMWFGANRLEGPLVASAVAAFALGMLAYFAARPALIRQEGRERRQCKRCG